MEVIVVVEKTIVAYGTWYLCRWFAYRSSV